MGVMVKEQCEKMVEVGWVGEGVMTVVVVL